MCNKPPQSSLAVFLCLSWEKGRYVQSFMSMRYELFGPLSCTECKSEELVGGLHPQGKSYHSVLSPILSEHGMQKNAFPTMATIISPQQAPLSCDLPTSPPLEPGQKYDRFGEWRMAATTPWLLRLDHKTCCNFCQAHGNYFHTESSELPCKQPNHQPPKSLHAVRKPRPMERPHTVIHLTNPAKVPANSCGNKQTSKERSRLWKWTFSLSHLHFPSWSPSYDKAKQSVTSMPLLNCQPEGFRGIKMFDILSYLGMDPCTASGTVAAVVV